MLQIIVDTTQGVAAPLASPSPSLPIVPVLVATLLGLLVISMALFKLMRLLRRPELHGLSRERIAQLWAQIEKTADQGTMGAKLAVIEADKLLDGALKSMMMPGDTLGERLKAAGYKYPDIRHVWGAHRLRNQLVHDSSFDLTTRQAHSALRDYKAALKTLNVF